MQHPRVFIRRTQTRNRISGEPYSTHRLVESSRVGNAVKQTTLLNLGSHFDLPQQQWPALARHIDELLRGQQPLCDATLSEAGQALAQRYAAQLIALRPSAAAVTAAEAAKAGPHEPGRYQEVDLDSLEMVRPRSVGVEHAALSAMRQYGLEDKLAELGLNRPQIAAAIGNIVGRMAHPGSELATHAWLQQRSALGELLGFDFESMDLSRLYRASDALYKHREALQDHLFAQAQSILGFGETDYPVRPDQHLLRGHRRRREQGQARAQQGKAQRLPAGDLGHGAGRQWLPAPQPGLCRQCQRARHDEGHAHGPGRTERRHGGDGRGHRHRSQPDWLRAQGYHYVVVSKLRERQFDPALATSTQSAGQATIKIQRVLDEQGHALLYCHSPAREQKDRAIDAAKTAGFEAVLLKLQAGLSKPRGTKDLAKIMERLGRAKQRYSRAAQHYQVELTKDDSGTQVRAITWTKRIKPGSAAAHPGVYCLRTTLVELDNATLWRTYTMLTNLESVFRSLKTDLGLRPVFHQIDRRVEGHLFITVLAYHFVHTLRLQLKAKGIDDSWQTLRETLATQRRVTATMQRRDGRAVHVRKATRPEPYHQTINKILALDPNPGGTHRVLV